MARSAPGTKKRKATKAPQSVKAKKPGTTPAKASSELEKDKSHIGRRVSKNFDGEIYSGTVTKFIGKHRLWKIKYDDGDAEEMDWNDLMNAVDLHDGRGRVKKSPNGKKRKSPPTHVLVTQSQSPPDDHRAKESNADEEETDDRRRSAGGGASKPPPATVDSDAAAGSEEGGIVLGDNDDDDDNAIAKSSSDHPSRRAFGRTTQPILVDGDLFARNPCRIPGGTNRDPSAYPNFHKGKGSFGFLIQRLSDRNYAMRALCLDGHGAEYNMYKKRGVNYISVVWYPPTNLNDHANDATIVDGCHLDLIDPTDGKTCLTGPILKAAIVDADQTVECVFLNGAESNRHSVISADDIASALRKCKDSLRCVSLTECKLNSSLVRTLASCPNLRGIILENCQLVVDGDDVPTDDVLASVLRSCPELRWCFVKSSLFGARCWRALAEEGRCPALEVLWVDAPTCKGDRIDAVRGDPEVVREALEGRRGTLKLCMINPDGRNESRYVIGGGEGTDRLNGRARTEEEKAPMRMMIPM